MAKTKQPGIFNSLEERVRRAVDRLDRVMDRMLHADRPGSPVQPPPDLPEVNIQVDPDIQPHLNFAISNTWERQGFISPEGLLLIQLIRDVNSLARKLESGDAREQ